MKSILKATLKALPMALITILAMHSLGGFIGGALFSAPAEGIIQVATDQPAPSFSHGVPTEDLNHLLTKPTLGTAVSFWAAHPWMTVFRNPDAKTYGEEWVPEKVRIEVTHEPVVAAKDDGTWEITFKPAASD